MPQSPASRKISDRISRNYGSRRGFAHATWHRLLHMTGRYRRYRRIDWGSVGRLVFVCKGNICRSVYAEAVARAAGLSAVSCGLDTVTGAPANVQAINVAAQRGIRLQNHRTTPIDSISLRVDDLLVAMEPGQAMQLRERSGTCHAITLAGLWCKPVNPYLTDPYGKSDAYFNRCFEQIEQSVNEIATQIT